MVPLRDVQGRIYCVKSESECLELGISTPVDSDIGRDHMVLVLGIVPRKVNYVKCMIITSKLKDSNEYIPISPTPKKGYAIQLRLQTRFGWYHGKFGRYIPTLAPPLYLKIDSYYEISIHMLDAVPDRSGEPLMIGAKHQGGLAELRDHVRCRDQFREGKKLCHMTETQSLEEDGV